jgi:hypothetical protein
LIPLGNPLIVTLTTLVNPFTAFNVTVTGALVPPTFVETDAGVMTTLKSATGGRGGDGGEELPHAFRRHKLPMKMMNNRNCFTVSSNVRRFEVIRHHLAQRAMQSACNHVARSELVLSSQRRWASTLCNS